MKNKLKETSIINRFMKVMLVLGFLIISSGGFADNLAYAQQQKFTFSFEQVSIKSIFQYIENNSEFVFMYRNDLLDTSKKISVKAKKKSIEQVLNEILSGSSVIYRINDRQITLMRGNEAAPQQSDKQPVKGSVKDGKGEPVIGASVVEKGTTNGTITDIDGNFTLNVNPGAVLEISYIGYKTQTVNATFSHSISVILEEDNEVLDEVVVIGYGTLKKKDLTGSVAGIGGDKISERKTTQLSTALQGAISGVTVTRNNGAPGAGASSINVRGITTISDSSPLVIIDGIPGGINDVSPDNVESLTVLKDAASASIYGSRAAAGVILITTKRAKEGEVSLSYNFEYGSDKPTRMPSYVGAIRYLEMVNETRYNDNKAGGWYQTYSEEQINNWMSNHQTDPNNYGNEDWTDLLFKDSAPHMTHSLNIKGGGKAIRTNASFRYDKNDGLYVNRNYNRWIISMNNDFNINKYIQANVDINFKRSNQKEPHTSPLLKEYRAVPPIYPAYFTNGYYADVKDGGNILAMMNEGGTTNSNYNKVNGKAQLDFKPIEGLKISAVLAPTYDFNNTKNFRKAIPYYKSTDLNNIASYMQGGYASTYLSEGRDTNLSLTTQFFANYVKSFGQHDITAMIGYEDYYAKWESVSASRDQYELINFPYLDLGPETYRDNGGNAHEYAYRSFFGRATYSYANRYLLQVNFRRDGSSRFAGDNRWANFPSVSLGWVMSEEPFWKKLNTEWFDYLKLRASWGTLGNERIGSYYPYQASLNFGSALIYNGNNVTSITSAAQQYYAVREISWETTESWDIGLDANFFGGRLRFTGDVYRKNTKDMLLSLEIPKFVGYDNPSVNAGKMHTTGFDIELGWNDHIGDFNYSISANLSDFVSKMGDLNGTVFLGDQIKEEGSEFNEWYGYLSEGIYQTQEEVENSARINNNVTVGDLKYKDISGPDGVPDGKISPEYDRVLLGGSLPRYSFGLNFSGSWKGIDLGLMFQGVGKQNSQEYSYMWTGLQYNWGGFPQMIERKYWSETNSEAENRSVRYPRLTYNYQGVNTCMSDYWLFNGRYLRLKNITLGYTLPSVWTQKIAMQSVRFYVSGNDLFSFDSFPKGWDPEVSTSGYPITKSLLFGVSVKF